MRSLGKWGPHHHGGQPTNSWAPFTLAIACGVYFWANHLLYLRVGWSRSATLNHEGLCVGGVRRVVATITLDNSLNSVPSQESDMGPPPNGIQVSGTHSRCYGVTLIPPSGLKSSFLQLLGVLADSDCQLGPSPGIAFSPHSHLTQSYATFLLPGATASNYGCGVVNTHSFCPRTGRLRRVIPVPEVPIGLAKNFVETASQFS